MPCDTGSDPQVLKKEFSEKKLPVDLSVVKDGWNDKRIGTKWAPTSHAISVRAKEARQCIRDLAAQMVKNGEEGDIVMVSHGGVLHYFTEDWEDSGVYNGKQIRLDHLRSVRKLVFSFMSYSHLSPAMYCTSSFLTHSLLFHLKPF